QQSELRVATKQVVQVRRAAAPVADDEQRYLLQARVPHPPPREAAVEDPEGDAGQAVQGEEGNAGQIARAEPVVPENPGQVHGARDVEDMGRGESGFARGPQRPARLCGRRHRRHESSLPGWWNSFAAGSARAGKELGSYSAVARTSAVTSATKSCTSGSFHRGGGSAPAFTPQPGFLNIWGSMARVADQ